MSDTTPAAAQQSSSEEQSDTAPMSTTTSTIPAAEPSAHDIVKKLQANSAQFQKTICEFPVQSNTMEAALRRCSDEASYQEMVNEIAENAQKTRFIFAHPVEKLIADFLQLKLEVGSTVERKLYQGMTRDQFIDRMMAKRPVMFMTGFDSFVLRNGKEGHFGCNLFDAIGTDSESAEAPLAEYMSYDEMLISALLSCSSPTHLINNGSRGNRAAVSTCIPRAVYVAQVGTRFERDERMEYRHMIVTRSQNTSASGYGANRNKTVSKCSGLDLWATLYGCADGCFPSFDEVQTGQVKGQFMRINNSTYLNVDVYKKRLRLSLEPFLLEAQQRGVEEQSKVWVHLVGLGLGVWSVNMGAQAELLLDVVMDVLGDHAGRLTNVVDIDFPWFPPPLGNYAQRQNYDSIAAQLGVELHFTKNDPFQPSLDKQGKLVVANFAWDSNSFVGNEYWMGMLSASGDPAAAACSMIQELQNPYINPYLTASTSVFYDCKFN